MKKTGSELINEIVGPAGSSRNDGDFSRGRDVDVDDELWLPAGFPLGWAKVCLVQGAARQQSATKTEEKPDRREGNGINKTLSASLVRPRNRVKR
jgi:hypothetical protein